MSKSINYRTSILQLATLFCISGNYTCHLSDSNQIFHYKYCMSHSFRWKITTSNQSAMKLLHANISLDLMFSLLFVTHKLRCTISSYNKRHFQIERFDIILLVCFLAVIWSLFQYGQNYQLPVIHVLCMQGMKS